MVFSNVRASSEFANASKAACASASSQFDRGLDVLRFNLVERNLEIRS